MPSEITTLPLYAQYFRDPNEIDIPASDWGGFRSPNLTSLVPLSECAVDFSVKEIKRWQDTAKNIAFIILKIVIFPWGTYELVRYSAQRLIMAPLYPAQSRLIKAFTRQLSENTLNGDRLYLENLQTLHPNFIVRQVILEKNGVRYSGLLLGHASTIDNGQWALQAVGNFMAVEQVAKFCFEKYNECGYNTLLINGPSVGRSEGHATPDSMGEAQGIGISFIETALKGKKIVMAGLSLGGAAMGQAILKHEFKPGVRYLAVQQMTFDRVSNISAEVLGTCKWLVKKVIIWSGCEMDTVAASRKLQALQIPEVIVQASRLRVEGLPAPENFANDGIITQQGSLGYRLVEEGIVDRKVFRCLPYAGHMTLQSFTAAHAEILAL
ncbi:MAG: hypothetical protein H0V82_05950 [Candidatus Protochlamydia sp.]|nr:hypothetical protein [Candidatus Protochlamydia sp.]